MEVKCHVHVHRKDNWDRGSVTSGEPRTGLLDTNEFYHVYIDFTVNGEDTWRWDLTRQRIALGDTETARRTSGQCEAGADGVPYFITSAHSAIEWWNGDGRWRSY